VSKYVFDTPSGRIEEALRFLGMSGPLSMTEDALEALDMLHDADESYKLWPLWWALEDDERHGNLTGRAEDAYYRVKAVLTAAPVSVTADQEDGR
jgi:hypothetical protein